MLKNIERVDEKTLDEFVSALRYCTEQTERRCWEQWDGSFEVSPDGRPYHVQMIVQPTGDNPYSRNRRAFNAAFAGRTFRC